MFHTELLANSQEYNILKPYLSVCVVHRVPLHKSTKIPAFKSTSTSANQLFLFQFYTIVNQNWNFDFSSIQIHLHVSTNRESDWKLVKFRCLPFTSQPVNHSIFRTEAFGEILLEAPPISPYRTFQPISYSVYFIFYRLLHRWQCSDRY